MLTYKQFKTAIENLQSFMQEQQKLKELAQAISGKMAICEFGNQFIDDYIELMQASVNDKSGWVSWFVFDNEFGKNKLLICNKGKSYIITSVKHLYDICLNSKK